MAGGGVWDTGVEGFLPDMGGGDETGVDGFEP